MPSWLKLKLKGQWHIHPSARTSPEWPPFRAHEPRVAVHGAGGGWAWRAKFYLFPVLSSAGLVRARVASQQHTSQRSDNASEKRQAASNSRRTTCTRWPRDRRDRNVATVVSASPEAEVEAAILAPVSFVAANRTQRGGRGRLAHVRP